MSTIKQTHAFWRMKSVEMPWFYVIFLLLHFIFINSADAFIQSDLQIINIWSNFLYFKNI